MVVFTNTAISLDGRIGTARFDHVVIGTRTDRDYMSVLRARADAVLVGGRTFRNWPLPLVPDPAAIERLRAAGFPDVEVPPLEGRTWINAVVTRSLDLPREGRFYQDSRVRPLFLSATPGDMPGEVVVAPEITMPWVIEQLASRGVKRLLVEAGGDLLFQLVAAGVVHEMYVTICPRLLGGRGAPSLLDGEGFSGDQMRRLSLEELHPFGDELYARYRVLR